MPVFKSSKKFRIGEYEIEDLYGGPCIIDLDVLILDNIILNEDNLKIPQPLMHERDFVLRPLCEITPNMNHHLLKLSIMSLMQQPYKESRSSHGDY